MSGEVKAHTKTAKSQKTATASANLLLFPRLPWFVAGSRGEVKFAFRPISLRGISWSQMECAMEVLRLRVQRETAVVSKLQPSLVLPKHPARPPDC
jgi:hypothetical protein